MVRTMSADDASAHFADLIRSVSDTHEPVIVEQQGRPYAVLVSSEEYQRFHEEAERDWAIVEQVQDRNADMNPGAVFADVTREVEAVRQERYDEQAEWTPNRR